MTEEKIARITNKIKKHEIWEGICAFSTLICFIATIVFSNDMERMLTATIFLWASFLAQLIHKYFKQNYSEMLEE